jgi:hypothetical protein
MLMKKSLLATQIPNGHDAQMEVNPFTLAFSGNSSDLEKLFLEKYAIGSLPQVRLALLLGFIFYALFGALDAILALEMKRRFWYVRYGIVCPSILLAFLFSFSPHFHKFVQVVILALILVSGLDHD